MTATANPVVEAALDNKELSAAEIAAFLDGRLEGDALSRVQARLADDPAARQEVIKASRVLAGAPALAARPRPMRWIIPAAAVALAASVLIMVQPRATSSPERASTERRPVFEEADQISLVAPVNGALLNPGEGRFVWHGHAGATYRFYLLDETGRELYRRTVSDSILTLGSELAPQKGKLYWRVETLAENGTTLTSNFGEFRIRPR